LKALKHKELITYDKYIKLQKLQIFQTRDIPVNIQSFCSPLINFALRMESPFEGASQILY